MIRKLCLFAIIGCIIFTGAECCAQAKEQAGQQGAGQAGPGRQMENRGRMARPASNMYGGTVVSIDKSDPADIKIVVKSDTDQAAHTLHLVPYTSVTKITDISELKSGDMVRIISRKKDEKEEALGIIFGKLRMAPSVAAGAIPMTHPKQMRPKTAQENTKK